MSETSTILLAEHYLNVDQPENALEQLSKSESTDLDSALYWRLRAQALYELGRDEDAIVSVRKGLELTPEDDILLYRLCRIQLRQGDFAEAERAILSALRVSPENPLYLARYGVVLAQAGQFNKADKVLQAAENRNPESTYVVHCRSMLDFLQGKTREVVARSREQLAQNPENISARALLSAGLTEQHQITEASKHASAVVIDNPNNTDMVDFARDLRFANHWLMRPLWLFRRFGSLKVWLAVIILIYGLNFAGLTIISAILLIVYLILVIYSWVVPPILRRYLRRRF